MDLNIDREKEKKYEQAYVDASSIIYLYGKKTWELLDKKQTNPKTKQKTPHNVLLNTNIVTTDTGHVFHQSPNTFIKNKRTNRKNIVIII